VIPSFSFSQGNDMTSGRFFNNWSINMNAGTTLFFGDINEYLISRYQSEWQLAYGITLSKQLTPVFGLRGQLLNGKISGTKLKFKNGSPANLKFNADFFEYNVNVTLNLNHLFSPDNQQNLVSVYGFIGVGMSNWSTKLRNIETNTIVASNGQKGKGLKKLTNEGMMPAGLGLDIHLSKKWNLTVESGFRMVNSDKLDAAIGGFKYDMYNYSSLGITYTLNPSVIKKKLKKTDVSILEFTQEQSSVPISFPPLKITCELPKQILPGSLFDVRIKVLKSEMKGPGELHLNVPKGISWTGYCNAKASFDSKNQFIAVKWDELPSDAALLILFTLKPDTALRGDVEIAGKFFYKSGASDKIEPFSSTVSIKENQPKEVIKTSPVSKTDSTINREVKPADLKKNIADKKTMVYKSGIEYRVQIYAERKKMTSAEALARKFNILETISEDFYRGYYIYSTGSYSTNAEAVKQMKKIRLQNKVHDAFVVKFRDGKRINP